MGFSLACVVGFCLWALWREARDLQNFIGAFCRWNTVKSWYHEIMESTYDIKKVGSSGQITLGKRLAGKFLRIEEKPDGTMVLTPVIDIPESQLWVFQEPDKSKILAAVAWAEQHPAQVTDVGKLLKKVGVKPE
jgi:hypothetical protein